MVARSLRPNGCVFLSLLLLSSCGDGELEGGGEPPVDGAAVDDANADDTSDGGASDTSTPAIDGTVTDGAPVDTKKPELDVGACTAALSFVDVTLPQPAQRPFYAAAAPSGETVFAWSDGSVHVRRVDVTGATSGLDATIAGEGVHGLAVTADGAALLVARAPDVLAFVRVDAAGAVKADKELTGKSDHATVGSEWYDYNGSFFADGGRLFWNGTAYVANFPIYRRWPDMIAHTGDTLRHLGRDGVASGGGWSWGCSHSLDVRLAKSGDSEGVVCLSDCYSQKAILWHNSTVIPPEPTGNCSGTSQAALGGLVAVSDGFWLTYISPTGRQARDVALVKLGKDGKPGTPTWLTTGAADDHSSGAHLAPFAGGLLATYAKGGKSWVLRISLDGGAAGTPGTATELAAEFADKDDFFAWPNGDVGWVHPFAAMMRVYRYRACP